MSCRNCEDRFVGCHSSCKKYEQDTATRKRITEKRKKELNIDYALIGMGHIRCESLKKNMTGIR